MSVSADLRQATLQERYRILVESISDYAIFLLDHAGNVISWNSGARRIHGYDEGEIIGQHFSRFYTVQEKADGLPGLALQTARNEGRFEREAWRVRSDGTRFWAHVIIEPIHDEVGQVVGFAKITRDLTEQKLAQEKLRQAEEQFRILVQGVTDYAIFMLDPDGNVSSWNPGAERLKGYSPQEIIGQHFSCFYTDEDRREGMPGHALSTAREVGKFETEGWRVRKDHTRFWALVIIDAIRDDAGQIIGFAKVTRDVTDMKASREALEAFAYSVSHDLRAPLRGMEGFARIVLDDFADGLGDKGRAYMQRIVAAAGRMQQLVSDLLSFSRIQRAQMKLRPVDTNSILRRQIEEVLTAAGLERDVITISGSMPMVMAEPVVLGQVFANLLGNAVKFHRPGELPKVRVWAEQDDVRVRVSVEDEGIGVAPEHQEKIFGVFERLHGQEAYAGTGIGLAIAKMGVERMGGTIGLSSKTGKGTTFWFEIAAAQQRQESGATR